MLLVLARNLDLVLLFPLVTALCLVPLIADLGYLFYLWFIIIGGFCKFIKSSSSRFSTASDYCLYSSTHFNVNVFPSMFTKLKSHNGAIWELRYVLRRISSSFSTLKVLSDSSVHLYVLGPMPL
jgi:hypothetical protein